MFQPNSSDEEEEEQDSSQQKQKKRVLKGQPSFQLPIYESFKLNKFQQEDPVYKYDRKRTKWEGPKKQENIKEEDEEEEKVASRSYLKMTTRAQPSLSQSPNRHHQPIQVELSNERSPRANDSNLLQASMLTKQEFLAQSKPYQNKQNQKFNIYFSNHKKQVNNGDLKVIMDHEENSSNHSRSQRSFNQTQGKFRKSDYKLSAIKFAPQTSSQIRKKPGSPRRDVGQKQTIDNNREIVNELFQKKKEMSNLSHNLQAKIVDPKTIKNKFQPAAVVKKKNANDNAQANFLVEWEKYENLNFLPEDNSKSKGSPTKAARTGKDFNKFIAGQKQIQSKFVNNSTIIQPELGKVFSTGTKFPPHEFKEKGKKSVSPSKAPAGGQVIEVNRKKISNSRHKSVNDSLEKIPTHLTPHVSQPNSSLTTYDKRDILREQQKLRDLIQANTDMPMIDLDAIEKSSMVQIEEKFNNESETSSIPKLDFAEAQLKTLDNEACKRSRGARVQEAGKSKLSYDAPTNSEVMSKEKLKTVQTVKKQEITQSLLKKETDNQYIKQMQTPQEIAMRQNYNSKSSLQSKGQEIAATNALTQKTTTKKSHGDHHTTYRSSEDDGVPRTSSGIVVLQKKEAPKKNPEQKPPLVKGSEKKQGSSTERIGSRKYTQKSFQSTELKESPPNQAKTPKKHLQSSSLQIDENIPEKKRNSSLQQTKTGGKSNKSSHMNSQKSHKSSNRSVQEIKAEMNKNPLFEGASDKKGANSQASSRHSMESRKSQIEQMNKNPLLSGLNNSQSAGKLSVKEKPRQESQKKKKSQTASGTEYTEFEEEQQPASIEIGGKDIAQDTETQKKPQLQIVVDEPPVKKESDRKIEEQKAPADAGFDSYDMLQKAPVTETVQKAPVTETVKKAPVTETLQKAPVTETLQKSQAPAKVQQSPKAPTKPAMPSKVSSPKQPTIKQHSKPNILKKKSEASKPEALVHVEVQQIKEPPTTKENATSKQEQQIEVKNPDEPIKIEQKSAAEPTEPPHKQQIVEENKKEEPEPNKVKENNVAPQGSQPDNAEVKATAVEQQPDQKKPDLQAQKTKDKQQTTQDDAPAPLSDKKKSQEQVEQNIDQEMPMVKDNVATKQEELEEKKFQELDSSKHEVKISPQQEAIASPKNEAQVSPKVDTQALKVETQASPKVETQASPKVEAKASPKQEVQVSSQQEAQASPKQQAPVQLVHEAKASSDHEEQVSSKPQEQMSTSPEVQVSPKHEALASPKQEAPISPKQEAPVSPKQDQQPDQTIFPKAAETEPIQTAQNSAPQPNEHVDATLSDPKRVEPAAEVFSPQKQEAEVKADPQLQQEEHITAIPEAPIKPEQEQSNELALQLQNQSKHEDEVDHHRPPTNRLSTPQNEGGSAEDHGQPIDKDGLLQTVQNDLMDIFESVAEDVSAIEVIRDQEEQIKREQQKLEKQLQQQREDMEKQIKKKEEELKKKELDLKRREEEAQAKMDQQRKQQEEKAKAREEEQIKNKEEEKRQRMIREEELRLQALKKETEERYQKEQADLMRREEELKAKELKLMELEQNEIALKEEDHQDAEEQKQPQTQAAEEALYQTLAAQSKSPTRNQFQDKDVVIEEKQPLLSSKQDVIVEFEHMTQNKSASAEMIQLPQSNQATERALLETTKREEDTWNLSSAVNDIRKQNTPDTSIIKNQVLIEKSIKMDADLSINSKINNQEIHNSNDNMFMDKRTHKQPSIVLSQKDQDEKKGVFHIFKSQKSIKMHPVTQNELDLAKQATNKLSVDKSVSSRQSHMNEFDPEAENENYIQSLMAQTQQLLMDQNGKAKIKIFLKQKLKGTASNLKVSNVAQVLTNFRKNQKGRKDLSKKQITIKSGLPDDKVELFSYYSEDDDDEDGAMHLKDPRFDERMYNKITEERLFGIDPDSYAKKDRTNFLAAQYNLKKKVKEVDSKKLVSQMTFKKFNNKMSDLEESDDQKWTQKFDQTVGAMSKKIQDEDIEFDCYKFLHKFVFLPDNSIYFYFTILRLFSSMMETILYPFGAAQGFPDDFYHPMNLLLSISEFLFTLDIALRFFKAFKIEGDEEKYEKDLKNIAIHYYNGRFQKDLLLFFPFGEILSRFHPKLGVFYFLKSLRLKDQMDLFKPNVVRPLIRRRFTQKLDEVLKDENLKDDINQSNNFIMQRLKAQNFFNASRIFLGLTFFAFFTGTIWFALVVQYIQNDENLEDFHSVFFRPDQSSFEKEITSIYFAFTSLSTVGLGDLVPITDSERIVCAFMLLIGVATFSYVGENFSQMIQILRFFDKEYNEEEELTRFLVLIKKYNESRRLDQRFETEILSFFDYKWKHDRNYSIHLSQDLAIMNQLPTEVKISIFRSFLYHDFLFDFRRFFRFKKNFRFQARIGETNKMTKQERVIERFKRYPYYDFNDLEYQNFILAMLKTLEPRYFQQWEPIFRELDECLEMYFVLKGSFDIGYNINNRKFYRLRFDNRNVIGIFNVHFNHRVAYECRASTKMNCFGVRKVNWIYLMRLFPNFQQSMKIIIFDTYEHQIRMPLQRKKNDHIKKMTKRHDYSQILVLQNQNDAQFNQFRRHAFRQIMGMDEGKQEDELNLNKYMGGIQGNMDLSDTIFLIREIEKQVENAAVWLKFLQIKIKNVLKAAHRQQILQTQKKEQND